MTSGEKAFEAKAYSCSSCKGFHIEKVFSRKPTVPAPEPVPSNAFLASLETRKRRYFLVDIENLTGGAKISASEALKLWKVIKQQAPGVAPHDHVVFGASRGVFHKYRNAFAGQGIKWVIGDNAKDGADLALLSAVDIHRVSKDFQELVIVSGDHIFAPLARRAAQKGLTVHVITAAAKGQKSSLSRELKDASDIHSRIRDPKNISKKRSSSYRRKQRVSKVNLPSVAA